MKSYKVTITNIMDGVKQVVCNEHVTMTDIEVENLKAAGEVYENAFVKLVAKNGIENASVIVDIKPANNVLAYNKLLQRIENATNGIIKDYNGMTGEADSIFSNLIEVANKQQ